jgi:hypothetical protein
MCEHRKRRSKWGNKQAMCEHRKRRSKGGISKLYVNIGREDQKGGKYDIGGGWMMVSIQASVSGSIL